MNQLVHIRLPSELVKDLEKIVADGRYATVTDFVRDSVRKGIDEYHHQHALYLLRKNYGMKPDAKYITEEDRAAAFEESMAGKKSEALRRLGFDQVD